MVVHNGKKRLNDREVLLLVDKVSSGDKQAFHEFYNYFFPTLYHYAQSLLGNEEDARDVVQETFLQAHSGISQLKAHEKVSNWLYTITYHKCIDVIRKRKKWKQLNGILINEAKVEGLVVEGIDNKVEQWWIEKNVREVIDQLSSAKKNAVILFYQHGLSVKEIAEVQGTTETSIRAALYKSRKQIKQSMQNREKADLDDILAVFPFALPISEMSASNLSEEAWCNISDSLTSVQAASAKPAMLSMIIKWGVISSVTITSIIGGALLLSQKDEPASKPVESQTYSEMVQDVGEMIGEEDAKLLEEIVATSAIDNKDELSELTSRHGMSKILSCTGDESYNLYLMQQGDKKLTIYQNYNDDEQRAETMYMVGKKTEDTQNNKVYGQKSLPLPVVNTLDELY